MQAASANGMSRWGNGCVPGAKWAACCCVARSPRGSLILMLLQSLSFGPGKPLPEGGFPLLKIYELPLNGSSWPAATLHAFRGFPATKVAGKPTRKPPDVFFYRLLPNIFIRPIEYKFLYTDLQTYSNTCTHIF